ncbi:hypothetical protein GCM10028819_29450 [Spirosoma humi]
MPIQQSVQTLIRADDFHDKAFSFTVESIVDELPANHKELVVTVSEGYYMTTSQTSEPRREQTFEHSQQPNRQWVARGVVTLAYAEEYPVNGVLTIQNPAAETVVLPIEVTQAVTRNAGLTVSHSELSFTQTASDNSAYLLLTISQQPVDTPITLTTDLPAYFQLASDSRPYYSPTLTVVSPARKFHVHVRFAASKPGLYTGQLTIQTPSDRQIIPLRGRRTGWFSMPTGRRLAVNQQKRESSLSSGRSGNWFIIAVLAGMSGLGYIGYTQKCQLFPGLCQPVTPKAASVKQSLPTPGQPTVSVRSPNSEAKSITYPEKGHENLTQVIDSLARMRQSFAADKSGTKRTVVASGEEIATIRSKEPRRETVKKTAQQPKEPSQVKPPSVNEESELEKALNKPL